MKPVLVTGANGLLGQKVVDILRRRMPVVASGRQSEFVFGEWDVPYVQLDICHARRCREVFKQFKPDVVVNAASYTHVDRCEEEKAACWAANVKGVENLAQLCYRSQTKLIHISTDYVFDGQSGPYSEEDRPDPTCYYGKAKLASENAVRRVGIPYAILRTSVLYGVGRGVKQNFFLWVYQNLRRGQPIRVVTDQYNTPTLAEDLARTIWSIVQTGRYGLFHVAGSEFMNRYEFARLVARTFQVDAGLIQPVTTDQLQQKAKRPLRAGLRIDRARRELDYHPMATSDTLRFLQRQLTELE